MGLRRLVIHVEKLFKILFYRLAFFAALSKVPSPADVLQPTFNPA